MREIKSPNIFKMRITVLGFLALLIFGMTLGTNPVEAQPFAYVTNLFSNNVTVIDTATNMVVGPPIPVGNTPRGVAITPDGTRAYVANQGSNDVFVIDTATNMVVGPPIPVGTLPFGVAITPDGTSAYVANQGLSNVTVIDTATNMVVGPPIPVGTGPRGVAITPDGTRAYVTNLISSNVTVIDTATNMVVGPPIPVGTLPFGVAITPDGTRAYVTNISSSNVTVIDTATNMVVGPPIPVGTGPTGVAITPDGTRAYVANQFSNDVFVIDTATNMVVGPPIPVGTLPFGVAITPDGTRAYVTNQNSNNVTVIDTATNMVVGPPIPVGAGPFGVAITPLTQFINLSPNTATNDVLTNHTVIATIEAPIPFVLVTFEVISGPNAGLVSIPNSGECSPNDCTTDGNGQVSWTYSSAIPGTDIIVASFVDMTGQVIESNLVEKIWVSVISLSPAAATNDVGTDHAVTATVDIDGVPEPFVLVTFEVISGPNAGEMSDPDSGECTPNDDCITDADGQVSWTYRGGKVSGTDTIVASFFDEEFQVSIESNLVEKIWESIPIPTLSEWGLIAMAGILGIVGFMVIRRRKVRA